jgi:hypothetical protein
MRQLITSHAWSETGQDIVVAVRSYSPADRFTFCDLMSRKGYYNASDSGRDLMLQAARWSK